MTNASFATSFKCFELVTGYEIFECRVSVNSGRGNMGCGISNVEIGTKKKTLSTAPEDRDFKLSSVKLIFHHRQMMKLNEKFTNFLDSSHCFDDDKEKKTGYIDVVVERLMQRLICNVGNLDQRFSSKFLINLEPLKDYSFGRRKNFRYKYLVRLDLVSTPSLYPEFFEPPIQVMEGTDTESLPQGYAKIRVHGEFLEEWAGFISSNGFLRRDKIQERFVELLARAAARPSEPFSPDQVDESKHCGSPGKIVDPITLHHILKMKPVQQVFFGPAECNESRFPDPRDFRIAIVEGTPETRLHISFLSPTAQSLTSEAVEISITLGIGVSGWPLGSDFPFRLPLDHVDVILGYRAAQLDYYLVPKGPHPSIYCEGRTSIWEIRTLATEMFLEHHYSPTSVTYRIYKILVYLLDIFKGRGVKTINKYILKNLLFFELEHKKEMQNWTPKMISKRVLSILDRLLLCLRNQTLPSYIFTKKNLLLQEDALEEDYISDGDILELYLKQLYNEGVKFESDDGHCILVKDQLENVMLQKWDTVIANMLPPPSNRSRRLGVINNSSASISYTRQQMEYVALLIGEILTLKKIQRKNVSIKEKTTNVSDDSLSDRENFIYLLQMMFDQAKQKLISSFASHSTLSKTVSKNSLKLDQVILGYDLSTALLVDDIRRAKKTNFIFEDDMSIVVKIMEYLYKAIDSDGRILAPVLRPYLNQIFKGSHENCWFLHEWKKKTDLSEFQAIAAFSSLVLTGNIDPLDGILNSVSKGWDWANSCLKIMETIREENSTRMIIGNKMDSNEPGLRLIFAPYPQKTVRFNVPPIKPGNTNWNQARNSTKTTTMDRSEVDSRYATIKSFEDVLSSVISSAEPEEKEPFAKDNRSQSHVNVRLRSEKHPPHIQLRNGNPFTVASMETRRQGNHRGLGSIVQALISLQKLTILQEISQYLPDNERARVLSDIKKLSKEVQRLSVENYRKKTSLPTSPKNRFSFKKCTKTIPSRHNHQRRLSDSHPATVHKSSQLQKREIYRSLNEFTTDLDKDDGEKENDEVGKELKAHENKLKQGLEKMKKESLLGTCRQLRKQRPSTISDANMLYTIPRGGRCKRGSSTFPKSMINTPFYIKVSSYNSTFVEETRKY